ncbi:MAG: hypothetical protein BJ554DRAFT_2150, partial [Olpidium bornovanus]
RQCDQRRSSQSSTPAQCRDPLRANLAASYDAMSTDSALPPTIISLTTLPVTGPDKIPQHEWPVAAMTPSTPATWPISGFPSGESGRKQVCRVSGSATPSNNGEAVCAISSSRRETVSEILTSDGRSGSGASGWAVHKYTSSGRGPARTIVSSRGAAADKREERDRSGPVPSEPPRRWSRGRRGNPERRPAREGRPPA